MGRSQANLKLGVFQGLRGLSKDAKLLYFAILVEPTLNQAGIGALRERRWARDVELTGAETEKALQELDDKRYVFVDEDTEEILVRTLIRRDGVAEKPNLLWAACRAATLLVSPRLRRALAEELRKLPSKPEATVGKNGRLYEHPDPHATAAAIDPSSGPDDPTRELISNGSTTVPEPTGLNGSGTIQEPFRAEPFENGSRTTGGGGGGGGGGNHTPVSNNSPSKNTLVTAAPAGADFAAFYAAYPRRVGRKDSERKWNKAIKDGADPLAVIEGARRYAQQRADQDPRYTKHPATWLHQGCWMDEGDTELRLVSGGYQAWRNPTDPSVYDEDM
jgi:hypothetical protein